MKFTTRKNFPAIINHYFLCEAQDIAENIVLLPWGWKLTDGAACSSVPAGYWADFLQSGQNISVEALRVFLIAVYPDPKNCSVCTPNVCALLRAEIKPQKGLGVRRVTARIFNMQGRMLNRILLDNN